MRVTLSAASLLWAHRAAQAIERQGHLRYWITGAPNHKGYVDPSHVRYIPVPAYLRYGVERVLPGTWGQFTGINLGDNLFDLLASRHVGDCDIFHVFNHHGLFSMRRAARHGALTVVERASAHILTQRALLSEEFARHGKRLPNAYWPMVWKHVQEYQEADHIVVSSDFVKRTMVEQGVPAEKMTVVHLGVELAMFKPQPKRDDVFRVMFAGAISLQKGTHYLLEAFDRLDVPDKELLLVGKIYPEMERIVARYRDAIRYVPGVPQRELAALYSSASVFVTPSVQDGFSMVAVEAMACGVPVIVSENVGLPVNDGREGFVVPVRDPEAIVEKLVYLYENEAEREAMGRRAGDYARVFDWPNYQRQLIALYRRLAGSA